MPTSTTRPGNYQKTVAQASLVCKQWRDATCLTPRLWCNLWLKADSLHFDHEVVSAWCGRAGRIPKHLEVSATHCGGVNDFYQAEICAEYTSTCLFGNAIFEQLLKSAPGCWQSVTVDCPTSECLKNFVTPLRTSNCRGWHSIQSLKFITTNWCAWPDEGSIPFFDFVPETVTTLSLKLPFPHDVGFLVAAWEDPLGVPPPVLHRLTCLELLFGRFVDVGISPLFDALRHCANLERLKIDFNFATLAHISGIPSQSEASVTLPKLRSLELHRMDWSLDPLKELGMPSLQELHFCLPVGYDDLASSAVGNPGLDGQLINFIQERHDISVNLRSLYIQAVTFNNDTLFHLLRDLRSIEHLRLDHITLDSPANDFLSLSYLAPPCLPNLKTLEILNLRHDKSFEIPCLGSFVQSRGIGLTLTHL